MGQASSDRHIEGMRGEMGVRLGILDAISDSVKWVLVAGALLGGISAFHYYEDHSLLFRVIGLLIIVMVAAVMASQTEKGRIAWEFVRDARTEVRKVVWPTRRETLQTTGIVIVAVSLVALMLWMLDSLLGWLVRVLLGQGG